MQNIWSIFYICGGNRSEEQSQKKVAVKKKKKKDGKEDNKEKPKLKIKTKEMKEKEKADQKAIKQEQLKQQKEIIDFQKYLILKKELKRKQKEQKDKEKLQKEEKAKKQQEEKKMKQEQAINKLQQSVKSTKSNQQFNKSDVIQNDIVQLENNINEILQSSNKDSKEISRQISMKSQELNEKSQEINSAQLRRNSKMTSQQSIIQNQDEEDNQQQFELEEVDLLAIQFDNHLKELHSLQNFQYKEISQLFKKQKKNRIRSRIDDEEEADIIFTHQIKSLMSSQKKFILLSNIAIYETDVLEITKCFQSFPLDYLFGIYFDLEQTTCVLKPNNLSIVEYITFKVDPEMIYFLAAAFYQAVLGETQAHIQFDMVSKKQLDIIINSPNINNTLKDQFQAAEDLLQMNIMRYQLKNNVDFAGETLLAKFFVKFYKIDEKQLFNAELFLSTRSFYILIPEEDLMIRRNIYQDIDQIYYQKEYFIINFKDGKGNEYIYNPKCVSILLPLKEQMKQLGLIAMIFNESPNFKLDKRPQLQMASIKQYQEFKKKQQAQSKQNQ